MGSTLRIHVPGYKDGTRNTAMLAWETELYVAMEPATMQVWGDNELLIDPIRSCF